MDENLDLVQYTNRGRPSNAQRLKTPRQTKIELRKLKKQMNYKDGTEILLAISLVTDDMNRHVAMFPEVMFLDVTANTNRQKRDLFLMVVKDPCGSVYIGNITFIPSLIKLVPSVETSLKYILLTLYHETFNDVSTDGTSLIGFLKPY